MLSHGGDDAHRGHHCSSVSAGRDRGGACRGAGSSKAHASTFSEWDHRGHGCDKVQGDTVMRASKGGQCCNKVQWNQTVEEFVETQSWQTAQGTWLWGHRHGKMCMRDTDEARLMGT